MIDISIIVPVYNVEKYLEECINSIINQTLKNFEVILVNDGSTDRSGDICDEFSKIDSRIKVIHKENGGLSDARNTGIDIAIGDYILFVDSDDYISNKLLEVVYKEVKKYNPDLVVFNYKKVEENSRYSELEEEINNNYGIEIYDNIQGVSQLYTERYGEFNAGCTKLYKTGLFRKIKFPVNKLYEDALIAHEILYNSNKTIYIPMKLYYYRKRSGSIVNSNFTYKKLDFVEASYSAMIFFYKKGLKIQYEAQQRYIYYFFEYYNKAKNELTDWEYRTKNIKVDFKKSLKILLFSPIFSVKEKISWIIFLLIPNIYDIYFNKRKESLNDG